MDTRDFGARAMLNALPGEMSDALRGGFNDATALLLRDVTDYPPERPNQRYIRTRTLARSWSRLPVTGSGLALRSGVGSNENIAPYNRDVQSAEDQKPIHRGRWPTDEQISNARRDTVNGFVSDRFDALARKYGGRA